MKKRPLTEDENRQLTMTKLFHTNRLKKKINWKKLIILTLGGIGFILIIYFLDNYWFNLVSKFGLGIVLILISLYILDFKENKKESSKLLKIIQEVEDDVLIEVAEYHCKKAICFEEFEDEGNYYVMEIGENKLLFWRDSAYLEIGILPNTSFEVYENKKLEFLFRQRVRVLGCPIQAVKIRPEIKKAHWGEFPNHNEIIESTVDKFLNEIEKKYSS